MPPRRLAPGTVIDGFELQELLHQGGMATVWSVTHPGFDLPLVMKAPFVEWGEKPSAIVGFEVEQMIMPRLSGPHVPRFVAAAFSAQPYLVMERIPGSSLKALLGDLPRPPEEAARIAGKLARALHDLHRQSVIHLDVKPSNVMMRETGEAVLIDFGLSRHEHLPDLLAEETVLPVGTAAYIAPEQLHGDRSDPRSDIFALGVLLYLCTTGELPYGEPHTTGGMRVRLYRDPMPPRALNSECPPWLQEIVLKCLEIEPRLRYHSAAQLALDLEQPEQVRLTARAERKRRDSFRIVAQRWIKARRDTALATRTVSRQLAQAPIVMAAVDLSPEFGALADALRVTVRRILSIQPAARLTCVNVRKTPLLGVDAPETTGENPYLQRLVELKSWARPLAVDEDQVSFHVLDAVDPAAALVDYARRNHVDHIVIGARSSSTMRRYLGSVSSHVVAEAPCSVTVVRVPELASR